MQSELMIIERLTRVEEKIDTFLMKMLDQHEAIDDHEARLRVLESGSNKVYGIASIIVLIISVCGAFFLGEMFS